MHPSSIRQTIFSKPNRFRTHQLIVEDQIFFVNPHFLAEFSSYFEKMFFENFTESEGKAELHGERWEDVQTFLLVIGAETRREREEINEFNCSAMIRLSDIWDIPVLQIRIREFLDNRFLYCDSSFECTMDILIACDQYGICERPLMNVASKIAGFGKEKLMEEKVYEKISSVRLSSALFSASLLSPSEEISHSFSLSSVDEECSILDCDKKTSVNRCAQCGHNFCPSHTTVLCSNQPKLPDYQYMSVLPIVPKKRARLQLEEKGKSMEKVKIVTSKKGWCQVDPKFFE